MPIPKNITIKRISLVKKGANNQRLQFCKSADSDSKIICYECSKLRKDENEGPSPEMIKEIDSIIGGQDSACYALCGIANRNMQLNLNGNIEDQYRAAVYDAMKSNPSLYERHIRTILMIVCQGDYIYATN